MVYRTEKSNAENPHVWFDEGDVASAATLRRRARFCNIKKTGKSASLGLAMFAAFAVNAVAWAANVTLSFNASGGTQSTSQFMLGSQALTFDRTTIPSWITGLTLHQNIGGMINNSIGLTPAVGSWNTSGSSSTCTLDVTVAENTGAARSWTMNILNQSNGSVAWSMLVSQSAGSGGGTPATCYTVTFDPNGGNVGESSRSVADGSSIGTLPTPSRSGYSFAGWFTAASGGTQIASSTIVYGDVTYYAHWTERPSTGLALFYYHSDSSELNSLVDASTSYDTLTTFLADKTPSVTDSTASIGDVLDFGSSWNGNSKFNSAFDDYFYMVMSGRILAETSGLYEIGCAADDTCRVFIDGAFVCREATSSYAYNSGSIYLSGGSHDILIVFEDFSALYTSSVLATWKKPLCRNRCFPVEQVR